MIPAEVQQVSENSIILQGLINSGDIYLYNIKFEYGTSEDTEDAVNADPSYVYGNNTTTVQARLNNLISHTKYYFRITATGGTETYYSEVFSYTPGEPGTVTDPSSVRVFPNPADDYLIIRNTEPVKKAEIFDSSGRLLFIKTNEELIDISSWRPGIYLIKIYSGDKIITRKIYKR